MLKYSESQNVSEQTRKYKLRKQREKEDSTQFNIFNSSINSR